MSNYTTDQIEPDPDFSQAEAPEGFQFSEDGTTLNVQEADTFPEAIKNDVDGLLWLGYLTDTFELYGHKFTIKTLTRGEKLIVSQITKQYEETLGMADAYEAAQVAASLMALDGIPLADIDPQSDQGARIRANFERVKGWYDPVLANVFDRVVALNVRQQQAFLAFQSK